MPISSGGAFQDGAEVLRSLQKPVLRQRLFYAGCVGLAINTIMLVVFGAHSGLTFNYMVESLIYTAIFGGAIWSAKSDWRIDLVSWAFPTTFFSALWILVGLDVLENDLHIFDISLMIFAPLCVFFFYKSKALLAMSFLQATFVFLFLRHFLSSSPSSLIASGEVVGFSLATAIFVFALMCIMSLMVRASEAAERSVSELIVQKSRMATADQLTGLNNRHAFHAYADRLDDAGLQSGTTAISMDLDGFKPVNDCYGHGVGDSLLKHVASRLQTHVDADGFVGRMGGDEFIIIVHGLIGEAAIDDYVCRIMDSLRQPYHVDGHVLKIGVSIGLAQYPQHGETIARLTDRADTALYASKDQGRGIYTLFEHSLEGERQLEQHVQNKLRDAIANGDIKMHYQPIFNPGSGRVNSVEALARWTDDALGVIAPSTFIKVAESSGHIFELSGHILNTVCEDMKRMPGVRVAVNISAQQFGRADFVQTVADLLKRHKVPVGMLMLEITETSLLKDMDRAKATLEALRGLGVHVALDDFGVGYSSMGYLRQLSLSRLKIDISFVRELTTDDRSIPIISAMVAVGKSLGIQIVAEGVETVEQRKILERIGCDYLQGYLFAEPAPLDDMQTLLKAQGAPSQKPLKRA